MHIKPFLFLLLLGALLWPMFSHAERVTLSPVEGSAPFTQNFVLTAYYSPIEGQCCYLRGSLAAERVLNGDGHTAADGTKVYPGMIAAPNSYPFGTRIKLPGLGVFTVHDRGGAINELGDGSVRLDLWMGDDEEALAQALEFGVQRMTGTVYPTGSMQPDEHVNLAMLPAPFERLRALLQPRFSLLTSKVNAGERGLTVMLLQERLRDAGYFAHAVTGLFGEQTQKSLARLLADLGLRERSDTLTETSAAYVLSASRTDMKQVPFIGRESSVASIQFAKRLLRSLGYFRGRTNGRYDDALFTAILKFQQGHALVGGPENAGAGRIGPLTQAALKKSWWKELVAARAQKILLRHKVERTLADRGVLPARVLTVGDHGSDVSRLQTLLADRNLFPREKINGVFGPLTEQTVLAYQLQEGILGKKNDLGAGRAGPATLHALTKDVVNSAVARVKEGGWKNL